MGAEELVEIEVKVSEEMVKVTIELPKRLVDFLRVMCEFGHKKLEEDLVVRLIRDVGCDFNNFDPFGSDCFGITRSDLLKKYNLEKVFEEYGVQIDRSFEVVENE